MNPGKTKDQESQEKPKSENLMGKGGEKSQKTNGNRTQPMKIPKNDLTTPPPNRLEQMVVKECVDESTQASTPGRYVVTVLVCVCQLWLLIMWHATVW